MDFSPILAAVDFGPLLLVLGVLVIGIIGVISLLRGTCKTLHFIQGGFKGGRARMPGMGGRARMPDDGKGKGC